jgi:hypothetical protein
MRTLISNTSKLERVASEISHLTDVDPARAVATARHLRGVGALQKPVQLLRGGALIDAGGAAADRNAVVEGIKIFRELVARHPAEVVFRYNLANGLSQLAHFESPKTPQWYVTTSEPRREARRLLDEVAKASTRVSLRAQALINLGNELDRGYRWVEAYDRWADAAKIDPTNTVAALSATLMLTRRIAHHPNHPRALHRVAAYYARLAQKGASSIERIAGLPAATRARALRVPRASWKPRELHRIKDDFSRFVASNRLALIGTIEGLDLRKKRWDNVYISGISEDIKAGPDVPPIIAMINQLKADFCGARWLAYTARTSPPQDTALYIDTLDYSVYGAGPSLLVLAQRAALDVLDRVAVCASDYLKTGDKPNTIHFRPFWREKGGTGAWRPTILEEITAGNPGLIALGELALDLCQGGLLSFKHELRNIGTHRFVVLHDIGAIASRPSDAIEHFDINVWFAETIATLQTARSAILYLLDAIDWRERRTRSERAFTMPLIPHHRIRGETPRPRHRPGDSQA